MTRLFLFTVVLGACAEPARATPPVDAGGLSRCFAEAQEGGDVDRAIARCEAAHFGTEWRTSEATRSSLGGNLDPRLVQAGIEAREGRMRTCYRAGVRRDPTLRGETKVRCVIDANGHATSVTDAGSKMRDAQVVQCVLGEYAALRFPRPEHGTVTIVHPMLFSPGDTHH